jgi:hypothetical protein
MFLVIETGLYGRIIGLLQICWMTRGVKGYWGVDKLSY